MSLNGLQDREHHYNFNTEIHLLLFRTHCVMKKHSESGAQIFIFNDNFWFWRFCSSVSVNFMKKVKMEFNENLWLSVVI